MASIIRIITFLLISNLISCSDSSNFEENASQRSITSIERARVSRQALWSAWTRPPSTRSLRRRFTCRSPAASCAAVSRRPSGRLTPPRRGRACARRPSPRSSPEGSFGDPSSGESTFGSTRTRASPTSRTASSPGTRIPTRLSEPCPGK